MAEKIKVTAEQAKGLNNILETIKREDDPTSVFYSKTNTIQYFLEDFTFCEDRAGANTLSKEDFITALVVGFESPYKEIKDKLQKAHNLEMTDSTPYANTDKIYSIGFYEGVEFVLEALDIDLNK
ncbi:hypothetical protein ACIU4M_00640 [Bacillus altitudinis]|uniref:hypothetical protein n=1 Tax=Bacillus altitudinis TaxID=293387 RepID=UPI00389A6EC4